MMNNLSTQIATTREQSERLLAMGVKPETADMYAKFDGNPYCITCTLKVNDAFVPAILKEDDYPTWSLSRLISMMPHYVYSIPYHLSVTHGLVKYTHPKVGDKIGCCRKNIFDNCLSMIDWLIKNNHFNKEYLK